ncbi:MAG: hypothetical protein MHM6MM_009138, partial [Cercozoa sp. M6MM]
MKVIVQRVSAGGVSVGGEEVARIGRGLLCLVGIHKDDHLLSAHKLAKKLANLRVFSNADGKPWAESAKQQGLEILLVSQFTLMARMKGNKPDFHGAMNGDFS